MSLLPSSKTSFPLPRLTGPLFEGVLYSALSLLLIFLCFYTASLYDEFLFSIVGKSIAAGTGWRLHYPHVLAKPLLDTSGLFTPEPAAGPLFMLILATAIKLAGPLYWVPGFVTLLLNICLLCVILVKASRSSLAWDYKKRILFVILVLLCSSDHAAINMPLLMKFFHKAYGDMSAALSIVLGLMIFMDCIEKRKRLWQAAIPGVIAVLIKPLPILSWVAGLGCAAVTRFRDFRLFLQISAVALAPIIVNKIYDLIKYALVGASAEKLKLVEKDFFLYEGSGIGPLLDAHDKWSYLVHNVESNFKKISAYYGSGFIVVLLFIMVVTLFIYALRKSFKQPKAGRLEGILLFSAAALIQIVWCLFISVAPWERHLLSAVIITNTLFIISLNNSVPWIRYGSAVLITLIISAKLLMLPAAINTIEPSIQRLDSQLQTSAYLESIPLSNSTTLLGCEWWANRDMEYLMAGQDHFKNCREVLHETGDMDQQLILVKSDFWGSPDSRFEALRQICEKRIVFQSKLHTVAACGSKADVLSELKQMGYAPF